MITKLQEKKEGVRNIKKTRDIKREIYNFLYSLFLNSKLKEKKENQHKESEYSFCKDFFLKLRK